MNIICIIIFAILFVVFGFVMFLTKKASLKDVFCTYFRNYFSNALEESDRRSNVFFIIGFGLLPYALGVLLFFGFEEIFTSFQTDLLIQIDIILLTIFCLFIGFNFKKDYKEPVKKELLATLFVALLLVVFSTILLLIASSITIEDNTSQTAIIWKRILLSVYFSFHFKIFVLFFYSIKRMFILS